MAARHSSSTGSPDTPANRFRRRHLSAALHLAPEPDPRAEPALRVEAAAFVLALRGHGVSDLSVLRAMETVPREIFAPRRYGDLARHDIALPLACGQTMSAPTTVAQMLVALGVQPGHRVLEIGTGSGYVAALLMRMGADLRTVERHPVLAESAGHRLLAAGIAGACELACRDGLEEAGDGSRFDRILVNGALATLPPGLTSRLAAGGRLVCGLTRAEGGVALLIASRDEDGRLSTRAGGPVRLQRLAAPDDAGATEA